MAGATTKAPFTGFVHVVNGHPAWTGKVELIESKLTEPLHWRKPARIFVNSMSDLFHEALPDESIRRVFKVICECRGRHTFQILTKRAERMHDWFAWVKTREPGWFKPNGTLDLWGTWLGVSVEDQKTADERSAILRQVPAAIRFISQEPQLEYINWRPGMLDGISWLIQGGESGPGARAFDLDWARETQDDCRTAKTAYFFKQGGSNVFDSSLTASGRSETVHFQDRKGGDMTEWSPELRVREFPEARS